MNFHLRIRTGSILFLSATIVSFAVMPVSYAATKASPTPKASAKPAPTANPKITKPPAAASGGAERGGRFANLTTAQRACLVKNGVTLPAPRPTGVRPTASPNATRSPSGFGARNTFNNPKTIAAFKNCGIALPTGGSGGGTFNSAKFQAFQKCMTAAGFQSTGGFGRYDQSDPSTVAALIKCQKSTGFTLPKPGANN